MSEMSDPFYIHGISKTDSNIPNVHAVNLNKDLQESKKDYRTFFEKESFEKYIEMYPKTEVRKRVLGRVRIPD